MSDPPFRCFRDLSNQHGPLMHLKLGESNTIVVSSPEMAKKMLKDLDPGFAERPQSVASKIMWYDRTDLGFSPCGGYWRQMRKLCISELFSPKMVDLFQSIREDESARLVKSLRESSGNAVNITEKLFAMASSVTCRAAFGAACKDNEMLLKTMADSQKMVAGFEIVDLFPSSRIADVMSWRKLQLMKVMRRRLDAILDDVIARHRSNRAESGGRRLGNSEFGSEDLVDVFLRAKEEGQLQYPIDDNNIKAVLFDMFTAGTDTSASTTDWTLVELLRHPRVMAKVQAEVRQALKGNRASIEQNDAVHDMKYLKLVIKETLRLHPPAPMLPRACIDEHVIDGYTIPAGSMVMVNIWAMQRDLRYWKDPETFEPERFENEELSFVGSDFKYLPFGIGRRICPGTSFGLAAMESALAQLLYHFDWKLPEGVKAEDFDMTENIGNTASRIQNLHVMATPYEKP
ncbi:hypothetical protein SASPL_132395 [Salvia splendens]|uniref:Uncharacterized protein n=2 Tax=Salvia splendens TaxID=180675 RepID=A0A8X8ZI58_SALSN|nr:hypothetical protein SASPL_132393 [Salvia splendens]KAG6404819.1 hypothetical protein SASPL_132395 [Salvia splendens]